MQIPYVIVNGTIVVKKSKVLADVKPGQPKPKLTWDAEGRIYSITWSHDSKKIAVVVKHYKSGDTPEVDFGELVILRVN